MSKSLSNKNSRKLFHAAKIYNRCNKNCLKKGGDLNCKKTTDKITSASKKLHSKNNLEKEEAKIETLQERYISSEKKTTWIKISIII